MTHETLKFSVSLLIITDQTLFNVASFSAIKEEDTEKHEIKTQTHADGKEVLHINRILKKVIEERFVTIYFNDGDKYPFPTKVMGPDLKEVDNPRAPEQIELDGQFFVLIDTETQRIFFSDQKRKKTFNVWLNDKIKKTVLIKSIIAEKDFVAKIKSVSKISFSLAPNLLNSGGKGTLSSVLIEDIYGFDAERASVELDYRNKKITKKITEKIQNLLIQKANFDNIVVIGRNEDNLESTLNLSEIITKIEITVPSSREDKILDHELVFSYLIQQLKENAVQKESGGT